MLGMKILKYRFDTALILNNRHPLTPFHSKVNQTTSSKQTRSFHTRNEIKTTQSSNSPNTILIRVPCISLLSKNEYSLFILKKIKWPKQTNTLFPREKRDKTTQCSNCRKAIFIRFFYRIIIKWYTTSK